MLSCACALAGGGFARDDARVQVELGRLAQVQVLQPHGAQQPLRQLLLRAAAPQGMAAGAGKAWQRSWRGRPSRTCAGGLEGSGAAASDERDLRPGFQGPVLPKCCSDHSVGMAGTIAKNQCPARRRQQARMRAPASSARRTGRVSPGWGGPGRRVAAPMRGPPAGRQCR